MVAAWLCVSETGDDGTSKRMIHSTSASCPSSYQKFGRFMHHDWQRGLIPVFLGLQAVGTARWAEAWLFPLRGGKHFMLSPA